MSEKLPNNRPILIPRGVEEGVDLADRKVEVWRASDEVDEAGSQLAFGRTPHNIDGEIKYDSKSLDNIDPLSGQEIGSDEGQEALAREYSGMLLLGDKVLTKKFGDIVESTIVDYETINSKNGKPYVNLNIVDAAGNRSKIPLEATSMKLQAELAQAKNLKDAELGVEKALLAGDKDPSEEKHDPSKFAPLPGMHYPRRVPRKSDLELE